MPKTCNAYCGGLSFPDEYETCPRCGAPLQTKNVKDVKPTSTEVDVSEGEGWAD